MNREEVLDQLGDVASEVLGVDKAKVTENARFKEDLDADSLDLVEVVMAIEERFDISIPEEKLEGITTAGEAADLVVATAGERAETGIAGD